MRLANTLGLLEIRMLMESSFSHKAALLSLAVVVAGCSGSSGGGSSSTTTNFNLDEGNVTTMLEGQSYELVPDGGASVGASVQSWRWSDRPIIEGALSQCEPVQDFDSPRAATRLEAACSVPAKCNLSFDQVSSVELDGGGQSRFSVRVPVLKADVGVTYRLEATDTTGQTTVANFTFCLLAINEAPSAESDAFTVTEGIPLVVRGDSGINLLTNDSDDINVGNQPLSVSSTPVVPPTEAISFSLQPDGGFTYFYEGDATIAGGTQINDSFQYEITDGSFTSVGTVDLTIVAVDNPPVLDAQPPVQSFVAGIPVDVDFSEFFSDPEGGDLFFSATGLPAAGDLEITPLGVLIGSAVPEDIGEFEVVVEAADQQNSAVGLVTVIVTENFEPTVVPVPTQVVVFGDLFSLEMSGFFEDPEEEELSYSLVTDPPTELQINPESGLITGLITNAGDYEISVTATDSTGGSAEAIFTLRQLEQPNRAPVFIGQINSQSVTIGTNINPMSGEFTDPDDDNLDFTINNLPLGLSFNGNTGVLSGTPTELGESTLVITATDPDDLSVSSNSFTVDVTAIPNEAPIFTGSIANQFGNVGVPVSTIQGDFSDADEDVLSYSSTTLPAGLVINSTTGVISGTPTTVGTTNVSITATDPRLASATSNTFVIEIAPEINNPPVVTQITPSSSVSLQAEDSVTVVIAVDDEDVDSLIFSGVSNDPAIATVSGGTNGVFTVDAVSAGSTTLSLNVTDDASQQVTQTVNLTVTAIPNVAPVINGRTPTGPVNLDQGDSSAVTLNVTDEDLSTLTYSGVTNNAAIATVTTNADDSFNINGVSAGSTTITLTVEDDQGLVDSINVPVTVAAPPNGAPRIEGRTPSAASLVMIPGDARTITLTVADEELATVEYAAQSNSPDVATATITPANRIRIDAVGDGIATITMIVTDAEGLTDSDTINITVATPNTAPVITGRTPSVDTIVLEPGNSQGVTLTITDESNETLTYSVITNDDEVATASVNASGDFSITAVGDGDTTLILTVTDDGELSDDITVPVSVSSPNVAPDITSRVPSASTVSLLTGGTQAMTLVVSDESNATLTYSGSSNDDSVATVTVTTGGNFTITAQGEGDATLTLTVTDNGNLSDSIDVDVSVTTANADPVITSRTPSTPTITLESGATQALTLAVTDESTATLNYDGVSDNSAVAIVVYQESTDSYLITAVNVGDALLTLTVTDDGGLSDSVDVPVEVTALNLPPVIGSRTPSDDPLLLAAQESVIVELVVTDEELATLDYAADTSSAGVVTVTPGVAGSYTITSVNAGTTSVTLTVTDADGLTATEIFDVTVAVPDLPPSITSRSPATDLTLEPLDVEPVSFVIDDEETATIIISAESGDEAIATVTDNLDNTFGVTAIGSGTTVITYTITDAGGQSVTDTMSVTVDAEPVIVSRSPSGSISISDAGFIEVDLVVTDESPSTLDYNALSDDPLTATALVGGSNQIVISGVAAGTANVTVTVTDELGLNDEIVIPVTVTTSGGELAGAGGTGSA